MATHPVHHLLQMEGGQYHGRAGAQATVQVEGKLLKVVFQIQGLPEKLLILEQHRLSRVSKPDANSDLVVYTAVVCKQFMVVSLFQGCLRVQVTDERDAYNATNSAPVDAENAVLRVRNTPPSEKHLAEPMEEAAVFLQALMAREAALQQQLTELQGQIEAARTALQAAQADHVSARIFAALDAVQ